jgi:hypothetical protein
MVGLEKLLTIPRQEISEKTYIPLHEIDAILKQDFAIFNTSKAQGFIAILQREYNVDLSQWLEAFHAYEKEHTKKKRSVCCCS